MKNVGLLLAILLLSACSAAPPPVAVKPPSVARLAQGIDLPTDARDVSSELKGSHLDFVARYYRDPASRWPALSAEEARAVSSAGMKLVAVWESHSHKPGYFSYSSGYYDAMTAYREARAVGQPPGSAIYFAVDYNAPPWDIMGSIDQYFRGVLAGLAASSARKAPVYAVGVYGSGAVCDYLKHARLVKYAWLSNSTAWSGYDVFTDWNIRQRGSLVTLSFSQDGNEARGDYGGFEIAGAYSSL
jgi:hypothetical protein